MNKTFYQFLFFSLAFFFTFIPIKIEAQSADNKQPVKYKKARALQSSTAKKMAKVYEALEEVDEKGEPAPNMETVLSILNDLRDNKDDLKSYDRSVMWTAWAYVYFSEGQYSQALDSYRKLMNEPESTIPLRTGALLSMGQLSMVQENYDQGIKYILQWMDEVEKVTAQAWSFLGQAYYAKEDYRKSFSSIEKAIKLAEEEGYKPRENWYVIMAANINELKNEIGEEKALLQQIDIYEILVNLYPKKQYFIQLGGSYGQLGRERDYMITLKAAYLKDFLNKESEYLALAQLLLLNKNPYWAADVLVSGQKKMITIVDEETEEETIEPVVKDTEKNLKLLADSWRMAQEIDKAIPILERSAQMSKDGNSYVILGNLYLSEDRVEQAIKAINKGLEKGDIKNLSQVYLTLGQAYFELQNFEEARTNFRIAARDKKKTVKTQANTWLKYTENEEIRVKNLALRRDYIQQNSSS